LARRLSGTPEEAADLVQETFLRAVINHGTLPRTRDRQEAWLVRVLLNLCRDRWRQTAKRRQLQAVWGERPGGESTSPESVALARTVVWRAMNELPPRRRAVLIMHELEGESVATIARIIGVTSVTVRWHLFAARRQLKRAFGVTPDA
jgi:RNA polymerase sigma-70 factor (ECF subfamily)